MAGVVDTSLLFAALYPGDVHHDAAVRELSRHAGIEIPATILAETEGLLRKRVGLAKARGHLPRFLAGNPHVGVMDVDLHPAAMQIWKRHGRISYTDAHAVAGALHLKAELLTLDERQKAVWEKEGGA